MCSLKNKIKMLGTVASPSKNTIIKSNVKNVLENDCLIDFLLD